MYSVRFTYLQLTVDATKEQCSEIVTGFPPLLPCAKAIWEMIQLYRLLEVMKPYSVTAEGH